MLQTKLDTGTRWDEVLLRLDEYRFLIPKSYKPGMRVDALVFADSELIKYICHDESLEQAANVATLPGILKYSLAMPDMHQGYGFPIGGVAAMDLESGVISPGGVGFDINCGVRLMTSLLTVTDVRPNIEALANALFESIPAGTGAGGPITLSPCEMDAALKLGALWAVRNGYGTEDDIEHMEEHGSLADANPSAVSQRAKNRGTKQLGTLGSGNHFLEVQYVDEIFDKSAADAFGLFEGQVCFMVHCGSRGLGHQVCTDFVSMMQPVMQRYGIRIPDRELACCPIRSEEGQLYLHAMSAAANFAFANRQTIMHFVREVVKSMFGEAGQLKLLYDVAHNMAKIEMHKVDGESRKVIVHRKGATRAFPAGREELRGVFYGIGQPVMIPGDMGRASYVLVGTEEALAQTFGSVCHGAGRLLSRTRARKGQQAKDIVTNLQAAGIIAKATTREGLTEEISGAYKPIEQVVDVVQSTGLARRVARLKPMAVIKG